MKTISSPKAVPASTPAANSSTLELTRRQFLRQSSAVAGGLALYGAATADARAAGSPNERIRYALIGCGGQGNGHLDSVMKLKAGGYPVEIVAVCDVYAKRAEEAARKTGGKACADYRQVLEQKDIDAVGIAAPDHWHCKLVIEAADAGKDIYCEKPMTHWRDLTEPRRMVEAVARNKRVLQVGTQGMSEGIWEPIAEKIKAGAIGKVVHAQSSDMRNYSVGLYDPKSDDGVAKPGVNLDWDQWLGPAPKHAYECGRFFAFRCYWDYSGGVGTDFLPHLLTPLAFAMNLGFPRRVSALGGQCAYKGGREIPDIYNLLIEYAEGTTVYLMAGIANSTPIPTVIRGHEATVHVHKGPGAMILPEQAVKPGGEEVSIPQTRGGSVEEHYRNFFDCVKSRQKPRSNELLAHRVMTALNLGIHSFRTGRTWEYDAATDTGRAV
ncbi:MAG: Gfo/Idh/MocA family oxidoreductase [Verrucomicrobiota bacterium]